MVLPPPPSACSPCDCIPGTIPNETFKQQVIVLLCAILDALNAPGPVLLQEQPKKVEPPK